jgi:hypothetical protein
VPHLEKNHEKIKKKPIHGKGFPKIKHNLKSYADIQINLKQSQCLINYKGDATICREVKSICYCLPY